MIFNRPGISARLPSTRVGCDVHAIVVELSDMDIDVVPAGWLGRGVSTSRVRDENIWRQEIEGRIKVRQIRHLRYKFVV